jgi:hypothetical protein
MTNIFTGIPVVGLDASGNPLMVITNTDGNSVATANANAVGLGSPAPVTPALPGESPTPSASWGKVEITSLFANSSGDIIGLGLGSDQSGTTNNLVWTRTSDGWKIGLSGLTSQVRPTGLEYNSSWLVADGTKIISSNFAMATATPAGGFAASLPTVSNVAVIPVDSLNNNGSTIVATSINTVGSWTSGNAWAHSPGPVTQIPTGHLQTTYTFPGYSGANAQVQYATAGNIDSYGLMGSPQISVTWPA